MVTPYIDIVVILKVNHKKAIILKQSLFYIFIQKNDFFSPIELRMLNDQLIQLEKGFIYVDGLPGRPYLK